MSEQKKKPHIRIRPDAYGECDGCMFNGKHYCESEEKVGRQVRCATHQVVYELISGELPDGKM